MFCSPLQLMWDPNTHSGPNVLTGASPRVHLPSRLSLLVGTSLYLALIPFVTPQAHRQQILPSLGFPFQASPQGFSNTSTRERFSHPYKECFVLLPNRREISQSIPVLKIYLYGFCFMIEIIIASLLSSVGDSSNLNRVHELGCRGVHFFF